MFVYGGDVGVYISARLTWMFKIWKAELLVGVATLEIMSLDGKNWSSRWFHTDYFIREYLFLRWLTSFKSRWFTLYIHIFLMSVRQVFAEIQVVLFTCLWREVTETETAERASCLFSLFYKSTLFSCYYDYTQIQLDPLQIQMIPYSYLYDQKLQSIFSSFQGHILYDIYSYIYLLLF